MYVTRHMLRGCYLKGVQRMEVVVIYLGRTTPSGEKTRRKERRIKVILKGSFGIFEVKVPAGTELFELQVHVADAFKRPQRPNQWSKTRKWYKNRK